MLCSHHKFVPPTSPPPSHLSPHFFLCCLATGVETEIVKDLGLKTTQSFKKCCHKDWDMWLQQRSSFLADLKYCGQPEKLSEKKQVFS